MSRIQAVAGENVSAGGFNGSDSISPYDARKSIMHYLSETDRWLQKHCVSNVSELNADVTSLKKEQDGGKTDNKVISVTSSGGADVMGDED